MEVRIASTEVSTEKVSSYLWLTFAICFLGNVLAGMASTLMSVYLPVVVKDLVGSVNESELSQMSAYINALYFIGWAIGGLTIESLQLAPGQWRRLSEDEVMLALTTTPLRP